VTIAAGARTGGYGGSVISRRAATEVVDVVLDWYAANRRDLPWRQPRTSPWGVLVSEFMLQQTPVARVVGPWTAWLERWPTPAALAAEPAGEAVRAWGRLGYPRRALRLHRAATAIVEEHGGEVPSGYVELLTLPGVGSYTAAAVASFAYGRRHVVLDTNVRRVLARIAAGVEYPAASTTAAETALAERFLPDDSGRASRWAVASMELGAVLCTARSPHCDRCPITDHCAWLRAGRPAYAGPPRRGQTYEGTVRQCRGAVLAVLRTAGPTAEREILADWPDPAQRARAVESLVTDGLAVRTAAGRLTLP
jgi:A/G-specific adenine glycosylase